MARVFVIEDNQLIRDAVSQYFQIDGDEVVEFPHAKGVLDSLETQAPDVIILDVMLPDENGFVLAKRIRRRSNVPIIFLTAKEAESDRITGFEIGGDDYVVKPFSTKELVLRTRALLKRTHGEDEEDQSETEWELDGNRLLIDTRRHRALLNDEELQLTVSEWKILAYLSYRDQEVCSRRQILGECLDYLHEGPERTVDTHIANLRGKLGTSEWVETVRGYGYRFCGMRAEQKQS